MAGIVIPIETARARRELKLLQGGLKKTDVEVQKVDKSIAKVEKRAAKGLGSSKALQGLAKFNKGLKATAKRLLGLQAMFAGFTLVAVTTAVGVMGARFEKEMAVVGGVTRATAKEFKALEDQARKMGATTEWTASQAAGALRFLGMAGFEAMSAVEALPGVLDLATAGNVDLARSADIASNALTAMQLDVSELGRVNDVFIATMTRSNVDMEMLAESFKYAAPLARAMGYDIEQLSAMIGILGNAGIQGSMAGTQLSFAMQQLPKVWKELGMSGEGKNLVDAMEAMNEAAWSGNKIMKIFGARGGKAVLVLRDLIPQYKALAEANKNAKGESQALADVIRDTVVGDFNTLKSTMESIAIDTFQTYKTEIRGLLSGTTRYLRDNKTEIMLTLKGISELVVALTTAIGKMAEWSAAAVKGIGEVGKTIGQLSAEKDIGITDLLMPGKLGYKLGKKSQGEQSMEVGDIFGGGVTKRAITAAKAAKQQSQTSGGMADFYKRMGVQDKADIDKQTRDAEKEAALKNELARMAGGGGDISKEDRAKQERVLQQFNEMKATYRMNDTELALYELQKQYDAYGQFVKDKAALDQWYNDEKQRLTLEGSAQLKAHEITELENMTDSWLVRDEGMKAANERVQEANESATNMFEGMDSLMVNFGETYQSQLGGAFMDFFNKTKSAKEAFSDFSSSVVNDLIAMIAKQIIFNSLSSMFGGGAGGAGGLLSGLFSRAAGGEVSPGKGYWVGERGPEKFTPETKGRIEPAGGEQKAPEVKIANLMDPGMFNEWAASSAGQGAILNVVSRNPDSVKQALR